MHKVLCFQLSFPGNGFNNVLYSRPHRLANNPQDAKFREIESQSYFTAGGLPLISSSWRQVPSGSRPVIPPPGLNTCSQSPYATSSLTREWLRRLQLLLVLASAIILRSESCRILDQILMSQIRDSPNLEHQIPIPISPMNRPA
jgi:hypothetical protein